MVIPGLCAIPTDNPKERRLRKEHAPRIVDELLEDMKARGIRLDANIVPYVLFLKIRTAESHEEGFDLYRKVMGDLKGLADAETPSYTPSTLDGGRTRPLISAPGAHEVLRLFASRFYPDKPCAPPDLWLAMLWDLNGHGYRSSTVDYTMYILAIVDWKYRLVQKPWIYQELGSEEIQRQTEWASKAVRRIHKQISMEIHFAPGSETLNTLINAYQLLGRFDESLKVFNVAWLSGCIDRVTPIVMFDACGHKKRVAPAFMIWTMLVQRGWAFDKEMLDAWVECLSRLGHIDIATNFVCKYMGTPKAGYISNGNTEPDIETCTVLLKMAVTLGQNLEVKEKIRKYLPGVWSNLASKYVR
jgi:pentatricopeptide repeat protein